MLAHPLDEFTHEARIAYFSMEIVLHTQSPTYSGGLELPMVAVSLVSRAGYFRQEIDAQGQQIEHPDTWNPALWATALNAKIGVAIEGREVWIRGWLYILIGHINGGVPVILLVQIWMKTTAATVKNNLGWVAVMKSAICKNASFFKGHRIVRRSATEAYLG